MPRSRSLETRKESKLDKKNPENVKRRPKVKVFLGVVNFQVCLNFKIFFFCNIWLSSLLMRHYFFYVKNIKLRIVTFL